MRECVVLVLALITASPAQDARTTGEFAKKCTPKVMHRSVGIGQPSIRVRKGEKSTGFSPVITFEILESGEVARAYIKPSSGFADVDQYALRLIRVTRYNRRPGCGTIESHADVTIDFR